MSEQRWALHYRFRRDEGDARFGWAEQNPATGEWTTALDVAFATTYPSAEAARSAVLSAGPLLHASVWAIPLNAWTLKRVGDVGEPLTRYHDELSPRDLVSA